MENKRIKQGFTLIELLVIVLIIGILSAVALPQYQKAVTKSHLANLKGIVESVTQAAEVYYMENGSYPTSFSQLDIEIPTPISNTGTRATYSWGACWLGTEESNARVVCENTNNEILYLHRFAYTTNSPNQRGCRGGTPTAQAVCKADTQAQEPYAQEGKYAAYQY